MKNEIPIWERPFLTLEEASCYFTIGINAMRAIGNENPSLVIWRGNKRLFRRVLCEEYFEHVHTI